LGWEKRLGVRKKKGKTLYKTIIVITGPTAVGKTSLAFQVARHFNTSIISADSRQCYREMSIGVAKPTQEELQLVHHYFIGSHSIHDQVNASVFEEYALNAANEIFTSNDVAVMVGGTGLYIKAFCEGMDFIPVIPASIRESINASFENNGLQWLQEQVQQQDPLYYETGEIQNPRRLVRALEVIQATGRSIRSFQSGLANPRSFNIIKTGLQLPKEELHRNIDHRVDNMMEQGLLEEVRGLLPWRNLSALQTVGYSELYNYLDGKTSKEKAVMLIKMNTRQYAKRQMTWFKKDTSIRWFSPGAITEIIDYCQVK
jgi:tRNA dimethylallyltransferase